MEVSCHGLSHKNSFSESSLPPTLTEWGNGDNELCYINNVDVDFFNRSFEGAGIADHCDLKCIQDILDQSSHLLEVGAGIGRVVDYLLRHSRNNSITAVERNIKFLRYMKSNYSSNKLNFIYSNVLNFYSLKKFDLILMLFSGFSEFNHTEQGILLARLQRMMVKGGRLCIDSVKVGAECQISVKTDGQNHLAKLGDSYLHAYVSSTNEIIKHADMVGFASVEVRNYLTETGRERVIYILEK